MAVELEAELGVQQKTAWFFKKKLQIAIQSSSKEALKEQVEVDETLVGSCLEGQPGRSLEGKEAAMDTKNLRRSGWKDTVNAN